MDAQRATLLGESRIWTYRDLRATMSRREIDAAVELGHLVRLWKGSYVHARTIGAAVDAARRRGRVDCVSLLILLGVFARRDHRQHLQMDRTSTRIGPASGDVVRHWRRSAAPRRALIADVIEAIAQACRCQEPLWAIATLDSALHHGVLTRGRLDDVFALLPARFGSLRPHLDGRSEAGAESILRVLLRRWGWRVEVQVRIDGVGRVDLLVDGWLIVECDSEEFHGGWRAQRRDRRRDLAAAALGYVTVRPIAEDVFWHVDDVRRGIEGLLSERRPQHNVGETARRRR